MAERISVKICSFESHAARFLSVILFFRFVLGLVSERVDRIKPRSALLTASSLGKAFATCGSRTTTFVDSRIRLAYLPRTNLPRSDRLYSRLPQSLSSEELAFFIELSLTFCRWPRGNDPNRFCSLGV